MGRQDTPLQAGSVTATAPHLGPRPAPAFCTSQGKTLIYQDGATALPGSGLISLKTEAQRKAYRARCLAQQTQALNDYRREWPHKVGPAVSTCLNELWASWIEDHIQAARKQFFALQRDFDAVQRDGLQREAVAKLFKRWRLSLD